MTTKTTQNLQDKARRIQAKSGRERFGGKDNQKVSDSQKSHESPKQDLIKSPVAEESTTKPSQVESAPAETPAKIEQDANQKAGENALGDEGDEDQNTASEGESSEDEVIKVNKSSQDAAA